MTLVVIMLVVLLLAGLVLGYTAYPHRGEPVPGVPWVGEALERAADAVPYVEDGDLDVVSGRTVPRGSEGPIRPRID